MEVKMEIIYAPSGKGYWGNAPIVDCRNSGDITESGLAIITTALTGYASVQLALENLMNNPAVEPSLIEKAINYGAVGVATLLAPLAGAAIGREIKKRLK